MLAQEKESLPKVKSILISQPKPETEKSPYYDLADKWKVKIDFRKFIQVEGIEVKDFRKSRVNIHDYSAIIFTSRNAVDHFFRIADELRISMTQDTKYFCISEAIALYLQKYIQYRKRKVFFGTGRLSDFFDLLAKYKKGEKYLLPCSEIHKSDLPDFLEENKFDFTPAIFYRTVYSDLSDLEDIYYDVIAFYSPTGVKSLFHNFPGFKQNNTRIAAFGPATIQAVKDANLRCDIEAPTPDAPSMTMALEQYLEKSNV